MELVIVDDGTDPVKDIVFSSADTFNIRDKVRYFRLEKKLSIGAKRNFMNSQALNDIIVYMDDDDYSCEDRVKHSVDVLRSRPDVYCVGSSEIYIYFSHLRRIFCFGPYADNHATAGTFAFRRELLSLTRFKDEIAVGEEKDFLLDYKVPFCQLDSTKTILCFSHSHNTFDKKKMLVNPNPQIVHETARTIEDFIPDSWTRRFFLEEMETALEAYPAGDASMKPDVVEATKGIDKMLEEMHKANQQAQVAFTMDVPGKGRISLSPQEVAQLVNQQRDQIVALTTEMSSARERLTSQESFIALLQEQLSSLSLASTRAKSKPEL
jgi:hypothetical protein